MAAPSLGDDFRDLLSAFSAAKARFVVVGAYALAVHGRPRATGDLDIWIDPTARNAEAVYRALVEFGAPLEGIRESDFATPGVVYQIGVPPNRVDILTSVSGVRFAGAWKRRFSTTYEGVSFAVIGRNDFIANKRASGRPQDLVDAEAIAGTVRPRSRATRRRRRGGGRDPRRARAPR